MKLTLGAFLLALALLVVATAVPQRAEPEQSQMPLDVADIDLDGVDTVNISGWSVSVTIGGDAVPAATWASDGDCDVQSTRNGRTLEVTTTGNCYRGVELTLPGSVTRIDAESLDITAVAPIDELTLRVRHRLAWHGDARRLEVVEDPGEYADCPADAYEFCMTEIDISEARIDELDISTHDGHVDLAQPAAIGHAILRLGPKAGFSLGRVRSLGNVEVILVDDGVEEAPPGVAAAPAAAEPAQIAPVPTDTD